MASFETRGQIPSEGQKQIATKNQKNQPPDPKKMKNKIWQTILLAALLATSQAHSQSKKIALLVAIGDYPPASGWQKINASNDLLLVKEMLLRQGFAEANISKIENTAATRAGILQALQTQLLDRAGQGDVAYFQFSGHGQQVADQNGDEVDGFDEAIVPHDSPMKYDPASGNTGQNLVRDDELDQFFTKIRQKLGANGNLVVVLDACHSGTGTRGNSVARGTSQVMADSSYLKNLSRGSNSQTFDAAAANPNLAPMAAFFGASAHQLNFETRDDEGRQVGSLTYAFCKKIAAAADPQVSYRQLFEQIRQEMAIVAPRQSPQAEGILDQQIFGGKLLPPARFLKVNRWNDARTVGIEAGWMHGIEVGSVIGFFPADTRDPASAKPLARGQVNASRPFESTVALDEPLPQTEAMAAWAFVLERNFGDLKVKISLQLPDGDPTRQAFLEKIGKISLVQLSDDAPDLVVAVADADGGSGSSRGAAAVQVRTATNLVLENLEPTRQPTAAADRILRRAMEFAQGSFLRKMQQIALPLGLELEVVPIELDTRTMAEKREIPIAERGGGGGLQLRVGDVFKIKIKHRGEKAAYFTLLDIQPDNLVNVLVPSETETPAEMRLVPGQEITLPRFFEVAPPFGMEVFKLIATDQPVDLRSVAQSRGQGLKANPSPLEHLFAQTFGNDEVQTRGGKTISVGAGAMHVSTFSFSISEQ